MPEGEQLPEEEEVEGHRFTKPAGGATIGPPPDPSAADEDEDEVEGHGFVKPPSGASINPPDPS